MSKKEEYRAFNFYGGFNQKGDEYHILNYKTPLPWCNILSNQKFGSVISSYGTVYTFFKNSREYKLSSWCNDWVEFTPGEVYKGIFEKDYNLVYGFGYVKVLEEDEFIKKNMDIFVPENIDAKVSLITLENKYGETKEVNISYSLVPVLGVSEETDASHIVSRIVDDKFLEFRNPYNQHFSNITNYIACTFDDKENVKYSFDKEYYTISVNVSIPANSKISFAILLGSIENGNKDLIIEEINKFSSIKDIEKIYDGTKKYWRKLVVNNIDTKDEYLNIMANGWLLYQTIACRLFAKTGFYQSGGALGFRDQLQDTLSLIKVWPEKTRRQIVLHSSKQFEKGDVLHWWHEHNNAGIRTYFSDDYLWLPYVLTEYVKLTSDTSVLDEETPFLQDKDMGNFRELYDVFYETEHKASVYEHAKRTILYGLSRINEKNGLLDIGDGDWNDGFSNIRGQSVWLTFFMINILDIFKDLAHIKKDKEMYDTCKKMRHLLKQNVITNAWEDTQFVRAFFENGDVLGSMKNNECKIDLISQAWSVISLKDDKDIQDELRSALNSADKYLVDRENKIVKLLYPAFDKPKNNPGYIKAYVPGIRENGGQYTHAATWLAKAYFDIKEHDKAMEILNMINPINHSDTKEKADIYMVEPYVIAADVYSNPEHPGRGGWTWYTGSASWMYKIIEDYLS